MTTSRFPIRSTPWCSTLALAIAALSLNACGGDGSATSGSAPDASAGTSSSNAAAGSSDGTDDAGAGGDDRGSGGSSGQNAGAGKGGKSSGDAGDAGEPGNSAGSGNVSAAGGSGNSSGAGGAGSAGNAGSGGAGSAGTDSCEDGDAVCRSLSALGVDVSSTPRLDARGQPLPESYNPLGSRLRPIFPSLELFSAGMRFGAAASDAAVQEFHDDQGETGALPRVLRNLGDTAWTQAPLHTAVAADIDGDGVDEVVALYEAGQSLYFRPIRQIEQGEQQTEILAANLRAQSATLAAGDFDGDGKDELALGIVLSNRAEIRFFDDGDTSFVPLPELTKELPRGASSTELSFQLAAGNLDYDAADEIVAVANQIQDWNSGAAAATYTIWDDGATGAAELASDILVVRDGTLHSALAAGVDIVDMDFDGVGEVVLAGVTTPQVTTALEYVAVTLDDAAHGLAPLASRVILDSEAGKDRSDNPAYYRHMWVKGLDVDGDLVPEVLVNRHVLSSLTPAPSGGGSAWPTRFILPLQHFQPDSDFDMRRDNSAIAVGDFNGDRRDDIAFLNPARDNLYIYGIAGAASAPVVIADRSVTGVGEHTTPLLVPVNVDRDTAMIQYSEGESQLLFSEPVVIAAIAAPPCAEGIGQDTDACTTSYGSAESVGNGVDKSVTVSASVSVGVSFEERVFTQSQIELAATATFATTNTESTSASVEKSVTYTTGAMQDAVVFTTIPYDSYVYEIVSHSEPALVGETITINAPRQPLTLMVERSFYNERVAPGALRIDDGVFRHTVGAPSSYPKSADVLAMSGALQSPSRSVTQTGSVEVGLNVGTENTRSSALALGFEMSLTLTAGGVMAGFSVGAEVERNLSVTHGKSTSYAGSIGAIDSEHFADNLYTFGLFTYKHQAANGQEFEVINYWVD